MAIPFVNSIISWFLKKRKHQMELFIKYPVDVQEELILRLVQFAKSTEFGEQYDFTAINIADFSFLKYLNPRI